MLPLNKQHVLNIVTVSDHILPHLSYIEMDIEQCIL